MSARRRRALFLRLREISISLQGLTWVERLDYAFRKLNRIPALPRDVHDLGQMTAVDLTADNLADLYHQIDHEYVPDAYAEGLVLIVGEDDPESPEEMAHWWRELGAEVELHRLPGVHQDALTENVEELAGVLRKALA